MFIFEGKRDRVWVGEGQRERHTQNLKQAPGSELSAQNPSRGSTSQTARSWPEPKLDAYLTEPPRWPSFFLLINSDRHYSSIRNTLWHPLISDWSEIKHWNDISFWSKPCKNNKTGEPGWLSWLSVRLRLRSWSRGLWVRALRRALWWQLGAWSLLWILCLPLSLPLPCSGKINIKKIFFKVYLNIAKIIL